MRLICLAHSRKVGGRCFAGKISEGPSRGRWVRPVASTREGGIPESQCRYPDGTQPSLLDIVMVPLGDVSSHAFQSENHTLGSGPWGRVGRLPFSELSGLSDDPDGLWCNVPDLNRKNDRIPEGRVQSGGPSLLLVQADDVHLKVEPHSEYPGRISVRCFLRYRGVGYQLKVTDPVVENRARERGEGEYPLGQRYLTLSLSEPYKGFVYKLVAAIFPEPRRG